jgi:hypothetical protein
VLKRILAIGLVLTAVATSAVRAAAPNERAFNATALAAVEDHWTVAELTGKVDYLRTLIDAQYRSVGATGRVSDKAAILAHAVTFGKDPSMMALYRKSKSHYASLYQLRGTTGVVIHYVRAKGPSSGITSVDVFSYNQNDGWSAVYSQHTSVR